MSKIVGAHSGGRIGEIMDHGSSTLPIYALPCDGAAVSRTTYSSLFAVIGTTYGVGDGSTTFNVPNGQALFKRGAGSQSIGGVAHSATHGATSNDTMQGHAHTLSSVVVWGGTPGATPDAYAGTATHANSGSPTFNGGFITAPITEGANGTPRTAPETAPANLAITYGIVWK